MTSPKSPRNAIKRGANEVGEGVLFVGNPPMSCCSTGLEALYLSLSHSSCTWTMFLSGRWLARFVFFFGFGWTTLMNDDHNDGDDEMERIPFVLPQTQAEELQSLVHWLNRLIYEGSQHPLFVDSFGECRGNRSYWPLEVIFVIKTPPNPFLGNPGECSHSREPGVRVKMCHD